ncbi:electron transfer flavoprotein beta subunit lysine methyltransferase isoform X2 [Cephus cinctus]|nr:electron transfer flavoprotein beta subunit lysine methyltransferase isoform X2 [Cephus cinctus]XP_015605224.1 electron transfer flavoprotein beta subunit lysine methyltransferase isoform X2 [Cephus cinctus]
MTGFFHSSRIVRSILIETKSWIEFARRKGTVASPRDGEDVAEVREAILKNTEITQDHLTPELKLHLLTPNCPLYHAPNEDKSRSVGIPWPYQDPFWSIYWPGGQALTRFILDEGNTIFRSSSNGTSALRKDEITVLDLGAGCGASAIASKLTGASSVLANDIDPVACVAMNMNAALNSVQISISKENLIAQPYNGNFHVILVGDLLYDEVIAGSLIVWLNEALAAGSQIYLGDPGRHGLTDTLRRRWKILREYPLPENVRRENRGFDTACVWQFS